MALVRAERMASDSTSRQDTASARRSRRRYPLPCAPTPRWPRRPTRRGAMPAGGRPWWRPAAADAGASLQRSPIVTVERARPDRAPPAPLGLSTRPPSRAGRPPVRPLRRWRARRPCPRAEVRVAVDDALVTRSRVVPGTAVTMARSSPTSALNRLDLPTLGARPRRPVAVAQPPRPSRRRPSAPRSSRIGESRGHRSRSMK